MPKPITIGGSDVASICGLNPYESAFSAWLRLTGRVEPRMLGDTRFTEWGKRLERSILEKYADENGVAIEFGRPYGEPNASTFRDDWKRGTQDAFAVRGAERLWGIDAKNASAHMAKKWAPDNVPSQYLTQCLWYCHIFEVDRWDLAVLIGGNEYRQFEIARDAGLETLIVEQVTEWRARHLVHDEQPPAEVDAQSIEWINRHIAPNRRKADDELAHKIALYKNAWHAARIADEILEERKAAIIKDMLEVAQADEIESELGLVKYAKQTRRTVKWADVVDWVRKQPGVDLTALEQIIEQKTETTDYRVFRTPTNWSKEP